MCRFSHGFNSIYVDVARQDYAIIASGANAGNLVLYVADASSFALNQKVFYLGLDALGATVMTGTAMIWDKGSNWIALLALSTALLTPPQPTNVIVSGTINEIATTKREVEISGTVNDGFRDRSFTARRFSYDSTGTVRVYLNGIIKRLFEKRYTIDETIHNEKQFGAALYLEGIYCKDIETDAEIGLLGSTSYIAVKSIEQIGNDNRLVDYEVYNNDTIHSTAKFLTAFKKPVYFSGFPYTLMSAIGANTSSVYYRHEHLGLTADTLMNIAGHGVYKMKVEQQSTEQSFNVSLVTGIAAGEFSLAIDEAGHTLNIDEDDHELNIQQ
jgi:hypothetical protein